MTDDDGRLAFALVDKLPKPQKVVQATAADKRRIAGGKGAFTVAFADLVVGNDNIRDAAGKDNRGLADSIRYTGLTTALTVEARDGKWLVNAGHRRYLALRAIGLKGKDQVPVFPLSEADPARRLEVMLAENSNREGLTPIDEAEAFSKLIEWHGYSQADIAKRMRMNKNTVSSRLGLLSLPSEAQDMVSAGLMGVEVGQKFGRMCAAGLEERHVRKLLGYGQHLSELHLVDVERKVRGAAAVATLAARLEARGFAVLASPGRAVTRKGYEPTLGEFLGVLKPADIKALDPGKVKTLKSVDGRPCVVAKKDWQGSGVAYLVEEKKSFVAASSDFFHEAVVKVQGERSAARLDWVVENPGVVSDAELSAAVLYRMVDRFVARDLADALGLPVATVDDGRGGGIIDAEATVGLWVADSSAKRLRLLMFAALVRSAAKNGDGRPVADCSPDELMFREAGLPLITQARLEKRVMKVQEEMRAAANAEKEQDNE